MYIQNYTKRCPHCGKVLYSASVEQPRFFGNSMQQCPYCSTYYIDQSMYEWVNLTQEEKKSVLVFGCNISLLKESEVRAIYNKLKYTQFSLVTIPMVRKLKKEIELFENFEYNPLMLQDFKIQESIKRTNDIEYLKILLKMGRNYYGPEYKAET